jgi:hypothetical protein
MKAGYLYVMNTQPFYCKLHILDNCYHQQSAVFNTLATNTIWSCDPLGYVKSKSYNQSQCLLTSSSSERPTIGNDITLVQIRIIVCSAFLDCLSASISGI